MHRCHPAVRPRYASPTSVVVAKQGLREDLIIDLTWAAARSVSRINPSAPFRTSDPHHRVGRSFGVSFSNGWPSVSAMRSSKDQCTDDSSQATGGVLLFFDDPSFPAIPH
jgi:hypothetical protein